MIEIAVRKICGSVVLLSALTLPGPAICVTEDFSTRLDPLLWRLYGDAEHDTNKGWLQLTADKTNQFSSIFYLKPIHTAYFKARFDVYLGGHDGADGIVFAFVKEPGVGIEGFGGQMGFLTGLDGYGIEFDTYAGRAGTPGNQPDTENHVGVSNAEPGTSPGKGFAFYQNDNLPHGLENGTWFSAEVEFRSGHVLMWMWNDFIGWRKELVIDYLIPEWKNYDAYLGFTAATGGATNMQAVDNVRFTPQTPKPLKKWYVDASAPSSGDGTSWETAFNEIQWAINAASEGDIVNVAVGVYEENINFVGRNITLRGTDPVNPYIVASTIVHGRWVGPAVLFVGTEDESCVLSGLNIGYGMTVFGGGIRGSTGEQHTHATIRNCIIGANTATDSGGGIAFCDGLIRSNRIASNAAPQSFPRGNGGGLFQCNGTIQDNVITDNAAASSGGGLGECGGTISNNTIAENRADAGGGLDQCHGTITKNKIGQNYAVTWGGGLYRCNGTVEDNAITGNQSEAIGGGLSFCDAVIRDNIIAENTAHSWGGGLSHCGNLIRNNIIMANSAQNGAGLASCQAQIESNLIARNSASGDGGGLVDCRVMVLNDTIVENFAARGGGLFDCEGTVQNCIVWGNTASTSPQIFGGSVPIYSCIQNWTGGEGNINDDPQFVDPDGPDNNPNTYQDNNYRLQPDSPCIDAGKSERWMLGTFDLDGNPRVLYGWFLMSVDMGAYEYVPFDFRVQKVEAIPDGKIRLAWSSRPGTSYRLHVSSDLKIWSWTGEVIPASGTGTTTWTDNISGSRRFYRVQLFF